jgi:hypothetical protein
MSGVLFKIRFHSETQMEAKKAKRAKFQAFFALFAFFASLCIAAQEVDSVNVSDIRTYTGLELELFQFLQNSIDR